MGTHAAAHRINCGCGQVFELRNSGHVIGVRVFTLTPITPITPPIAQIHEEPCPLKQLQT